MDHHSQLFYIYDSYIRYSTRERSDMAVHIGVCDGSHLPCSCHSGTELAAGVHENVEEVACSVYKTSIVPSFNNIVHSDLPVRHTPLQICVDYRTYFMFPLLLLLVIALRQGSQMMGGDSCVRPCARKRPHTVFIEQ